MKTRMLVLIMAIFAVMAASAGAGVIFTEGFEDPVVPEIKPDSYQWVVWCMWPDLRDGQWPRWVGEGTKYSYVVHKDGGIGLLNISGDQIVGIFNNLPSGDTDMRLTTIADPENPNFLNTLIEADTTYSLTLKTASTFYPDKPWLPQEYHVQLIAADSDEILVEAIGPVMDNDFLTQGNQIAIAYRSGDDPTYVGERLAVRLRKGNGDYHHNVYYDDICVSEDIMNVSPFDGESVGYGTVDLSWDNKDAVVGDTVWVEIMYGTDPNSANPTYDWNKVMLATPDAETFQVTAAADTTYYWQVISYLYGDSVTDPCESDIYTFTAVADVAVQGVEIQRDGEPNDVVTWSGEGVDLTAVVDDDGSSTVTYEWSSNLEDGVVFSSTTAANPTVTITKTPGVGIVPLANASFDEFFELGGWWWWLNDGVRDTIAFPNFGWSQPNWGYYYNTYTGVYNPNTTAYADGEAADGRNVGFVESRMAAEGMWTAAGGFWQNTTTELKAGVTYTLSVKVGNPLFNTAFPGYRVMLYAHNGKLLAEDNDSIEIAKGTFEQSTVTFTCPDDHEDIGKNLRIQLATKANFVSQEADPEIYEVHFDDVHLTSDNGTTILVTVAAQDAVTPPITDTIAIDIYDDACQAKIATSGDEIDKGDINKDCITDIDDLKIVAAAWLDPSGLDAPAANSDTGNVVGDVNDITVNAGTDIVTWSDEPVTLDPTIDGPNSLTGVLTYHWSADPADNVVFSDPNIEAPTVTITNTELTPSYLSFVGNGSFEDPVTADNGSVNSGSVTSWSSGWLDPDVAGDTWNDRTDRGGVYNPPDTVYASVPDGENVGWVWIDDDSDHCLKQQLSLTVQPSTVYELQVKVGNPLDVPNANYRVELVAGEDIDTAGVLASATGASPNGTTDPEWFDVSVPFTSGAAPAADKLGVRLIAERTAGAPEGGVNRLNFDDVKLLVDGVAGEEVTPVVEMLSVTLSLAVNKEGETRDDVVDTMKIDVYGDSCLALAGAGQAYAETDFDGNCITNLADVVEVAKSWLNSLDLPTGPFAKP